MAMWPLNREQKGIPLWQSYIAGMRLAISDYGWQLSEEITTALQRQSKERDDRNDSSGGGRQIGCKQGRCAPSRAQGIDQSSQAHQRQSKATRHLARLT